MNRRIPAITASGLFAASALSAETSVPPASKPAVISLTDLRRDFADPPMEHLLCTWWHWQGGASPLGTPPERNGNSHLPWYIKRGRVTDSYSPAGETMTDASLAEQMPPIHRVLCRLDEGKE